MHIVNNYTQGRYLANAYNKENDPVLSREEALAILNTPDDQLDDLIARAENSGEI